ncbi:mitogen-activated protein kinase-binding protein 1-like, partial [Saccostrea cucullata]|uniref:mitogen-activated protein kinase-binding protein 1-like n=1 Tax=Saccostrea cuccullata TaxID=36930 RepID=UPI002ED126B5
MPRAALRSSSAAALRKVTLERVIGLTVSTNATLTCDLNTGTIAYPAGCVVVLFNPRRNKQSHIFNTSKKTITSLAFSPDGKQLVTGE